MKYLNILVLLFILALISACSSKALLQKKSIGLINNVSFVDSSFDNPNASNGFLVTHKNETYGITAKHVLMISKTDKMKFVDFEGELEEWKMHPKNDTAAFVIMDKLLNTNRKDSLTWDYMFSNWDSYNDWLVFSVKENRMNHRALEFRDRPLEKGEQLFAIGWAYQDTIGAQRIYEYKYDTTAGNYHNLIQIEGPSKLGGLSGAPIVDKKGKLVGLVTSGGEDEITKQVILEVTSAGNIIKFITGLN